jgi:D-alanyl-D-alanine dipeptidase
MSTRSVWLSDPQVTTIPIAECGEPLVDLRTVDALRLDPRLADPAGAYAHLRVGVVDRLVTAQTLLPGGLRLLVVEGYRPIAVQAARFEAVTANLRDQYPGRSHRWYSRRAGCDVVPPELSPHVGGAAVDLTLCTVHRIEADLGTEVHATGFDRGNRPGVPAPVRRLREHLRSALSRVGLVNHPDQWWHWSYGDRYWAYLNDAPAGHYGCVTLTAHEPSQKVPP